MNALRAELLATDLAPAGDEDRLDPLFARAVDAVLALDSRGQRLAIRLENTPYDALIDLSSQLRAFGVDANISRALVDVLEEQAVHLGVDFTKKEKPTPLKIFFGVMDEPPALDDSKTHFMVAWDGNRKYGASYSTVGMSFVNRGGNNTKITQTNTPDLETMFTGGGEKYLVLWCEKTVADGVGGLDENGVRAASVVEAIGPVQAASEGGRKILDAAQLDDLPPQTQKLLETIADMKQTVALARFEGAVADAAPVLETLKQSLPAQVIAASIEAPLAPVMVKAVNQAMDITAVEIVPETLSADGSVADRSAPDTPRAETTVTRNAVVEVGAAPAPVSFMNDNAPAALATTSADPAPIALAVSNPRENIVQAAPENSRLVEINPVVTERRMDAPAAPSVMQSVVTITQPLPPQAIAPVAPVAPAVQIPAPASSPVQITVQAQAQTPAPVTASPSAPIPATPVTPVAAPVSSVAPVAAPVTVSVSNIPSVPSPVVAPVAATPSAPAPSSPAMPQYAVKNVQGFEKEIAPLRRENPVLEALKPDSSGKISYEKINDVLHLLPPQVKQDVLKLINKTTEPVITPDDREKMERERIRDLDARDRERAREREIETARREREAERERDMAMRHFRETLSQDFSALYREEKAAPRGNNDNRFEDMFAKKETALFGETQKSDNRLTEKFTKVCAVTGRECSSAACGPCIENASSKPSEPKFLR